MFTPTQASWLNLIVVRDPERTVAMAQVAVHPPLACGVVTVVGVRQGGTLERAELGLVLERLPSIRGIKLERH